MPYNTRRKSLSLPSLGIQLPSTSRAHRSNSKTAIAAPEVESPPSKRIKREHTNESLLPSPQRSPSIPNAAPLTASQPVQPVQPIPPTKPVEQRIIAHTPPPSPGDVTSSRKIAIEGVKDDVVVSVIEQLEKTGNRPHLLKELAHVLLSTNQNIAHSANAAALLSSRLTQYMKRPWTASAPCPIAKELIPVHPRKVFFFLTSQPRGPIPTSSDDIIPPVLADIKRLTPSISNASVNEDAEMDMLERNRLSPSPEVEFNTIETTDELDDDILPPPTPGSPFDQPNMDLDLALDPSTRPLIRAPSPGLEADERGFTETASAVRAYKQMPLSQTSISIREVADVQPRTDHEAGIELFGRSHGTLSAFNANQLGMLSSPMMPPVKGLHHLTVPDLNMDLDMNDDNWNLKSPELVSVDELDRMLDDY